ncbi:hypothetical protein [Psychromonas antarctica]|jgi:hypothetical protein|uniref:hypothetical protein n=1 Tax=Psychromonas antarctica TaxID=67573 RepID=UPI001EE8B328|nr:hypothetical protein [Psychromonas antarctica]MCG6201140.1 hypothetical protein [Psychromonas antarctica]
MISLQKQNGMALFIAMLVLPLLLVLGVLVMNHSFLGLKIIDTRVMQGESNLKLTGAAQDILHQTGSATKFAEALPSASFTSSLFGEVNASVDLQGELNCRRRMQASGSNFKCKYLQLNLNHAYGREQTGVRWAINSMGLGVEQPIIVD